MKLSTKINIIFTILAIIISTISIIIDWRQNIQLDNLQYELNALNFKPVIKVNKIFLTSFKESEDSISFHHDLVDSNRQTSTKSKIEIDITFDIENVGNTNAKIISAFFTDTTSGDDILRELIYGKRLVHRNYFANNEFYSFLQLQPKDQYKLKFRRKIQFINEELFALHLLIFYKNDLGILYDSYYWAKFQKKDLKIDSRNGHTIYSKLIGDMNDFAKFIDDNITYKIYKKEEKDNFESLRNKSK